LLTSQDQLKGPKAVGRSAGETETNTMLSGAATASIGAAVAVGFTLHALLLGGSLGNVLANGAPTAPAASAPAAAAAAVTSERPLFQPAVGDTAPDFVLLDGDGRAFHAAEAWKENRLVLYFYPADFTPGCLRETAEFARLTPAFDSLGVRLAGVSVDDRSSHRRFAEHCGATFPLLADTSATVARAYGVNYRFEQRDRVREVAKRRTFVIDRGGRILLRYDEVDPGRHAEDVLAELRKR